MDSGELVARLSADITQYTAGLRTAQQATTKFATDLRKSLNGLTLVDEGKLAANARKIASTLTTGIRQNLTQTQTSLAEQFARNLLSPDAFKRAGDEAMREANAAILNKIDELRSSGRLTEPIRAALVSQLHTVGVDAGDAFNNGFSGRVQKLLASGGTLGKSLQEAGQTLTATITAPAVALGGVAFKIAADAAESASKMQAIFGAATDGVNKDLQRLTSSVPQTLAQLQESVSDAFSLLRGFGAGAKQAEGFSVSVVRLAADIASLRNIPFKEAFAAVSAGLRGESEPVARFGADVRVAALEAEGLRSGLLKTGQTLSALGRTQAAYNILVAAQSAAIGDAARTSGSAANSLKFFEQSARELAQTIGDQLLPILTPLIQQATALVKNLAQTSPGLLRMGIGLTAVAAAIGPVLLGLGGLLRLTALIATAFKSFAAAEGIGVLVTGLGALAATLTGVGVIGGLIALTLWLTRSKDASADSASNLDRYRASLSGLTDAQIASAKAQALQENAYLKAESTRLGLQLALNKQTDNGGAKQREAQAAIAARLGTVNAALRENEQRLSAVGLEAEKAAKRQAAYREELELLKKNAGNALGVTGVDASTSKKTALEVLATSAANALESIKGLREASSQTVGSVQAVVNAYDAVAATLARIGDSGAKGASDLRRVFGELSNDPVIEFFRTGKRSLELSATIKLTAGTENETKERVAALFRAVTISPGFDFSGADAEVRRLGVTVQAALNEAVLGLRVAPKIGIEIDTSGISGGIRGLAVDSVRAAQRMRRFADATIALAPFAGVIQKTADALDGVGTILVRVAGAISSPAALAGTALKGFTSAVSLTVKGLAQIVRGIGSTILSALNPINIFASFASKIGEALSPALSALEGPLGKLATVVADSLTPVFTALAPVVDALVPVIRELFNAIGPILVAVAPILKALVILLQPMIVIIKYAAISLTYLGQIVLTIASVLSRFFGNLIIGFGNVIEVIARAVDKLPFVSAKGAISFAEGIQDMGRSMLAVSDTLKESSDALGKARDQIKEGNYSDLAAGSAAAADGLNKTADSANKLTEQLKNVPEGFRVALARFRAQAPVIANGGIPQSVNPPLVRPAFPTGGLGAGSASIQLLGDIYVTADSESTAATVFADILTKAERSASANTGKSSNYPAALPDTARAYARSLRRGV